MNIVSDSSLVLYLPLYWPDGSSFMSRDACGHLCTVTGALWRPNGRYFDGTDDRIVTSATVPFNANNIYTVLVWANAGSNGDPLCVVSLGQGAVNAKIDDLSFRALRVRFCNMAGAWTSAGSLLSQDAWYHLALVRDNVNNWVKIYVNAEIDTDEAYATDNTNTTDAVNIGRLMRATPSEYFEGLIGEVWICNRALTPLEIRHNYLATKWRYQ